MSGISLLCSLIGVSLALVIGTSTAADAQTTALRGARVIDGRGGAPIDNATIVIRGGRIVAIGSSSGTPVPNGAEVVNYSGKTIIPGLISDHSHVGIFVGLKAAPENYSRDSILRQLKLAEEGWFDTADFCATGCQRKNLRIKMWQPAPCEIPIDQIEDILGRGSDGNRGYYAAAKLLRKMLRAGLSRYEPLPAEALAAKGAAHEPTAA
jgi:hypothetical protein